MSSIVKVKDSEEYHIGFRDKVSAKGSTGHNSSRACISKSIIINARGLTGFHGLTHKLLKLSLCQWEMP